MFLRGKHDERKERKTVFATPDLVKSVIVTNFTLSISEDFILMDGIFTSLHPKEDGLGTEERDVIVSRVVFSPKMLLVLKTVVDTTIKGYEKEFKTKIELPEMEIETKKI